MDASLFLTVLEKMAFLLLLMAIGFILAKTKIVGLRVVNRQQIFIKFRLNWNHRTIQCHKMDRLQHFGRREILRA